MTPTTLAILEHALGKDQRVFSQHAVRELIGAVRRLEAENAGLHRTLDELLAELALRRPFNNGAAPQGS